MTINSTALLFDGHYCIQFWYYD